MEALAAKGVEVSAGLASNVKYTSGPGGKRKKRGRKKAAGRKRGRPAASSSALSVDDLIESKKLAQELGGIDAARKALDTLATLQN